MKTLLVCLAAGCLLIASCAQQSPPVAPAGDSTSAAQPAAQKAPAPPAAAAVQPAAAPATPLADFAETDALPLLRWRPLQPVRPSLWTARTGSMAYTPLQQPDRWGEPYATDQEAVAAAIAFIIDQFGPLAPGVSLRPGDIDHSATGNPAPTGKGDRGHTVVLHQCYRGVMTERNAVVYIRGRTIDNASSDLATFEEMPTTARRIVTRADATKALRQVAESYGADSAAAFDHRPELMLYYAYESYYGGERDDCSYAGPNWVLTWNKEILVGGFTGKVWRND